MICKNCGKEIAEDSSFCEFCGKPCQNVSKNPDIKTNVKSSSKKGKTAAKIIGTFLLITVLLVGYFAYVSYWYDNNYYGIADSTIEKMSYSGEQLVSNIEIDAENNYLKLNLSKNNFEEIIPDSLDIKSIGTAFTENYCVYDYNTDNYCFEYVDPEMHWIEPIKENKSHYSKYLTFNLNKDNLEEGEIYCLNLEFYLSLNESYGNIFRKLFIKTIENSYVNRYIYYIIPKRNTLEHFEANSYFVYENGSFKPLLLNNNLDKYVNAVWDNTDLNVIKYDEQGNMYLEGPVRNRENIKIDNN